MRDGCEDGGSTLQSRSRLPHDGLTAWEMHCRRRGRRSPCWSTVRSHYCSQSLLSSKCSAWREGSCGNAVVPVSLLFAENSRQVSCKLCGPYLAEALELACARENEARRRVAGRRQVCNACLRPNVFSMSRNVTAVAQAWEVSESASASAARTAEAGYRGRSEQTLVQACDSASCAYDPLSLQRRSHECSTHLVSASSNSNRPR